MAEFAALPDNTSLLDAIALARKRVWIVSPFVTRGGVELIRRALNGLDSRLILRLDRPDVEAGVMHPDAIQTLVAQGVRVRDAGASLHAKCWIVDDAVFIGSANLTARALTKNQEILLRVSGSTPPGMEAITWFNRLFATSTTLSESRLATAAQWAKIARRRRRSQGTDGDEQEVIARPPSSGRAQWIHVGGYAPTPQPADVPIRQIARFQSAATFPTRQYPTGTWPGAPIFFVHSARRRQGGQKGWAVIGMAWLRDSVRRVKPDDLDFIRARVSVEAWEEISNYPHLGWVVGAEFLDLPIGDAPFIDDILLPSGHEVIPATSTFNRGWYLLDEERAAAIEAFLTEQFSMHPCVTPDSEDEIWWTHYLPEGERFTREEIEAALGPPGYLV